MSSPTVPLDTLYRHKRTGNVYRTLHTGQLKIGATDGLGSMAWVPCVVYTNARHGGVFARDLDAFVQNFEQVPHG